MAPEAKDLARLREAFVGTHAQLWRSLLAYSGDPDVASDAAAEAFAQAGRRLEAIHDVEAWVWRAAFRIAGGLLAERARSDDPMPERAAMPVPERAWELLDALGRLSDQQRRCVVLRHVAGYSAPEIAELLESSAASVRVQLMRARRKLRTLLEEDDT